MSEPVLLTPERLRAMPLPRPDQDGDKDGRGRVLIVAGSREVPGAAVLAGMSALRAGAGKLQVCTVASAATPAAFALPEARVIGFDETPEGEIAGEPARERLGALARGCDALLIGPGIIDEVAAARVTSDLLNLSVDAAVVVDAAGLCALEACRAKLAAGDGRLVLTPHAGEMAHLLGRSKAEVEADPLAAAEETSRRYKCVVVMKGQKTHIVAPGGRRWLNTEGHVGLATSGSGDTLAGLIAGLLARGAEPGEAAAWGVYAHAQAGARLGKHYEGIGYMAHELPEQFTHVLNGLCAGEDAPG